MSIQPSPKELAQIRKYMARANWEFENLSPEIQAKQFVEKRVYDLGTTEGIQRLNLWEIRREYRKLFLKRIR